MFTLFHWAIWTVIVSFLVGGRAKNEWNELNEWRIIIILLPLFSSLHLYTHLIEISNSCLASSTVAQTPLIECKQISYSFSIFSVHTLLWLREKKRWNHRWHECVHALCVWVRARVSVGFCWHEIKIIYSIMEGARCFANKKQFYRTFILWV